MNDPRLSPPMAEWAPMTEIRILRTDTTGRYLVEPGPVGAPLLVGFHGYGQNAETMLEVMRRIPGAERWTLVSVQSLHRFYNAKTQEVVGSWMTSLDRDQAIEDNLAYVRRVLAGLGTEHKSGKLVFAGFSQGAAMAWRAATCAGPCDGLLVLGGDLPKDAAEAPGALPPILIGRGDQDTFYGSGQLMKDLAVLEARDVRPEVLRFDGGHEWHPDFLEAAGRFLEQVRA